MIYLHNYNNFLNENNTFTQNIYFENIKLNSDEVINYIDFYDSWRDLYPGYSGNENEYEDEYMYDSKEELYEKINRVLDMFDSLPNSIPIYRAIYVKSLDDIDYNNLGESWSFEKNSAINFARNQNRGNVLLSAKTNFDNVDWKNTLKLFFEFSGNFDSYNEDEINIVDADKIFDLNVEKIK